MMRRSLLHGILTLAAAAAIVALAPPGGPARAQGADPAVTAVIDRQLDAFRAGDRNAAYAQAAPNIQARFPNAGLFMTMVEQGYSPLIGPKATDFLAPTPLSADRLVQPMALIDSQGRA